MDNMKIKWVIAHEPAYLFLRVAEDFQRLVNEKSKDVKIDIEILTAEEYNTKYQPTEAVSRMNLDELVRDNTVQITQMITSVLAKKFNKQMHAFDMPYIFRDHDHAQRVIEGEVGTKMLNSFPTESKLKGLAYTYSGGFRLLTLKDKVKSLAEVEGLAIRSGYSPQSQDTLASFGVKPVAGDLERVKELVQSNSAVGAEYVSQRILPDQQDEWINTIINTEHSLFMTNILVNTDWWNSLDAETQKIFEEAALEAARNERDLSVKDGQQSLETLKAQGVEVIELSAAEKEELKSRSAWIYDKYDDSYFEPGLIKTIKMQ